MGCRFVVVAAVGATLAACGYEIKLADAVRPWEKTAAQELGDYLKKLASDGSVSVGGAGEAVFHVGDTAFAREKGMGAVAFADEEWAVRSFGRDVVLSGGGMRGALYAVYHLLEDKCGVHWWHDGDEDVPEAKSFALPALDMRGRPYFLQRDIWRTATNDVRTLVRNRLNGNGGRPIPAAWGGGVSFGPPHLCHTWDRYLPFKKYGKEHPEWYSLRDGRRVGGQHHGQLCLSCPGLVEVFAAKVRESIASAEAKAKASGEPAPRFYDLTMNDNRFFCTCDPCRAEVAKYGYSGQQILFANRVAAIAGEGRPDLLFTVSSYSYSSDLPSNGVHTASNVVLRTGPVRDHDSLGAPLSAYYKQKVRGWRGFADKLFIWDYSNTYTELTEGMPFPSEYRYGEKYRFYAENGVKGVFWEHETPERQDMYELKFFLERRLLEDPYQDGKALMDEFYRLYYRAAAPHVRAARDHLLKIRDMRQPFITYMPRFGDFAWIGQDDLRIMEGHFRAAKAAAAGDAKLLRRIARARQSLVRVAEVRSRLRKCAPEPDFAGGRAFYEFSADWLDLYDKDNVKLRDDPLAASGKAVCVKADHDKYNLPFTVACNWSQSKRSPLKREYGELEPGDGYSWYMLDVPDVPTNGYFFATSAWSIQCPLGFPELAGRHCEVYFSARFTGPKYRPGSKDPNRIYVDRVRVVPVDGCVVAACAAPSSRKYEIRLPKNAKSWEKTAARELGEYLKKLATDGTVTVGGAGEAVFHVGDTAFAREKGMGAGAFADEEWAVRSFGRDVVLAGGGTRGTLYAVYHLLEDRCGVHWWHDDDEDVPEARSLALPVLEMRGKPYFLQRDIWRTVTNDVRTLVRNRLNGNGGHAIPLAWGGGVTYGPPHLCHTWDRYLPFKKYGKEHPEWYSLRDGKRVGGQHHGQLCLSCPGLAEILAAKVKESIASAEAKAKAKGDPAPRFYDLTMNDNTFFCTCDPCKAEVKKYGYSGQQIRFANRVAAIAGEGRPDLLFTISSYLYSSDLPSNGVHTAANVVLRTGPTRNSMGASVLHPDNAYFTKQIRGWKDFSDTLFIWDYSITYCKPTEGMPFPSEYHYGDKYRLYAECGVKGIFWEHETPAAQDMYELKFFIERKLLEDPGQDDAALLDDFYRRYYRAAAPHVRAARDHLRRIYDGKKAFVTWFPRFGEFSYIDTDDIREMEGHFRDAERAAAGDEKLLHRVAKARSGVMRVVAARARLRTCAPEMGFADGRPFYELDADWFDLYDRNNVKLLADPFAASGRAVCVNADSGRYDLPFTVACNWSQSERKPLKREYGELEPGDGYAWYMLDVPDVPTNGYFFVTSAWSIQCPLGFPEVSGRRCDVYFSARFTGPKFRPGSGEPNRIFVDRIRIVPVAAAEKPGIVPFRDAAKIKTWDAWNDHKGPQAWKEKPCVTWKRLNATGPGLRRIGTLKTRTAKEIRSSRWSVGCETLDRDYADWNQYKRFLGDLGAKRGRLFSGWAKTEQERGVYDFSWLDPQVREMAAMGVKPWLCISYGNPVWGSDFRLGMRVKQVTDAPDAFAAWLRYVKALVARYKDVVDEWEIWNEPFGQQEEYAKMVVETARAVKSIQPEAKCIVTAVGFGLTRDPAKNEYRAIAERLKAENACDLVKYWSFHPYCANPDWAYLTYGESEAIAESNEMTYEWRRYFAPEFEKFLKGYSKDWAVIQGEVGCPSQLEFAHALNGIEWTEYAQAKWNLRLQMGAAVREMPSSLFTFIDLQYTFMLQSFGLIRSNALKEPVYRRPSYYAMRNFYAVFDDDVSVRGFEKCRVGGKELSVAKFTRQGKPFAAVWLSGERPGDSLAYAAVDLSMLVKDRPTEWIDLLTGRVYGLCDIGVTPVWDSPVLLAGDGVIPLE